MPQFHQRTGVSTDVTVSTEVTASKDSLALQLSLNTSSPSAGGVAVSVIVDDYNTLSSTNNLTAANDWLVALNYLDGAPCSGDGWPVGFAIASEHYISSNVTAAKFLDLVDPNATYWCPNYGPFSNAVGFSFEPRSDTAAGYGCGPNSCLTWEVTTGLTSTIWGAVTGYWNQGGAFTSFPQGAYTVMAEDEWGNSVLAYFTVL